MQIHHFNQAAVYRLAIKRLGTEKLRERLGYDCVEALDNAETELLRGSMDSVVSFSMQQAQREYERFTGVSHGGDDFCNVWGELADIVDNGAYWEQC